MSSPSPSTGAPPPQAEDSDAQLARALAQLEAEHNPPLPPPPIRTRPSSSSSSTLDRRLQDLQDIEIAQLLDRVGHRLTDVRIAQAVDLRLAVDYPTTETFTSTTTGRVDWFGYVVAYTSCLVADFVPIELVEPTTTAAAAEKDFSLTDLRDQLERTYVLCPPPIWQRLVLSHLASLWRWDDPTRTGTCFGAYLLLWWYDLLFLAPCVALAAIIIKASFFPPSVDQLVRLAEDRNARSRDARVLGKQLNASSLFGYAGQGVKGIWSDLKARMRDVEPAEEEEEEEEVDVAGDGELPDEVRSRSATTTSSFPSVPSTKTPDSALGHLVSSSAILSTSTAAPSSAQAFAPKSGTGTEDLQEEQEQEQLRDPARRAPGGKEGDGDVSLYRLMRNLTATFGPNAILWLGELNDLGERIKNIIVHPEHPSVRYIALRLLAVCAALAVTPISLMYKALWLYLGIDFFIMWRVRSLYPEWRGVTLPHRWLLLGAPNDVQYALYALRQRQLAGNPIRGTKTLKRNARRQANIKASRGVRGGDLQGDDGGDSDGSLTTVGAASSTRSGGGGGGKMDKTKARARALSNTVATVLDEADKYRSRRSSDFFASPSSSSSSGGEATGSSLMPPPRSGKPEASYFALYASKPGSLCFYSDRFTFVPAKHLASLGRLGSRFSSRALEGEGEDPLVGDQQDDDDDASLAESTSSRRTFRSTISSVLAEGGEVGVLYEQIEGVSKHTKLRAFEGLGITTKDGRTVNFRNVSRRDEAFNKLLSFTAAKWKQQ